MKAVRMRVQLPARDAATAVAANPSGHHELSQRIAALNGLTAQQLRDEWRRLYRGQPPRLSRDLLIRTIAYRIQELVYGGLSKATQRKLDCVDEGTEGARGVSSSRPIQSLRPGARLVREWRGRTHTVVVTEDGFEYAGKAFPSLTKIAHAITGAHWSGPRFFGLIRKPASNGRLRSDATEIARCGGGGQWLIDLLPNRPPARLRCAIYTRKSSEEGLEQDFNSLDAQREACEAFIASQKREGWTLIGEMYDDGGFSGATMERPAFQRLLSDVSAGKIDVVVVYKVDRLTRSLSDFAKIVDIFDKHAVSFVSVTQQFNTTSSMGRLTLNILLSFAQFEREVTGERIRDKIAASKKKGMWMGGQPSLGYDVKDRRLIVNNAEAETVRHIFRRYTELKSVRELKEDLDAAGIVSKVRTASDGSRYGGQPIARGALYLMLQNRIYRGEIVHKGKSYPGEHEAIVDEALWNNVQAILSENRVDRANRTTGHEPSLLTGILFDAQGGRMSPTHANKKGTRYRYYISRSLLEGSMKTKAEGQQIPAVALEIPCRSSHSRLACRPRGHPSGHSTCRFRRRNPKAADRARERSCQARP